MRHYLKAADGRMVTNDTKAGPWLTGNEALAYSFEDRPQAEREQPKYEAALGVTLRLVPAPVLAGQGPMPRSGQHRARDYEIVVLQAQDGRWDYGPRVLRAAIESGEGAYLTQDDALKAARASIGEAS